jgi:hypothetical protein
MLKKPDRPIVWVILWSCFFAGFGFAVGEAVQRVNDAAALNAVYQHKNIFEWAREYFDPRVTLFTLVFVIVGAHPDHLGSTNVVTDENDTLVICSPHLSSSSMMIVWYATTRAIRPASRK